MADSQLNNNDSVCTDSIENVEKTKHTQPFTRTRSRNVSSMMHSWADISYRIGTSFDNYGLFTAYSLIDVPSSDRQSNTFLMGASLQSMILGTTMLSLPFCIKVAGAWSILLTIFIGLLTNFTANILVDCQYQESFQKPGFKKRIYPSFIEMSTACWKTCGRYIMELMVYLSLARNVVVVILLTDVSSDVFLHFGVTSYDRKYLSVAWSLLSIPFLFITKVSVLAWCSFIGLILYLVALLAMLVIFCLSSSTWHLTDISMDFNVKGVGIAAGIIINSYAVHMNLPCLEASMENPRVYKTATTVTFILNIISKIAFSCFGYLTYLNATDQEITSNIHIFSPLPIIMRCAVMFFAFTTIPLQSFVVFKLIDDTFQHHFTVFKNRKICWLILSRTLFTFLSLFMAVLVPQFGIVVSLIGSIRGSMIALVLPASYYVRLQTNDVRFFTKTLCYFTIVFGFVTSILGLYSSFEGLLFGI